MFVKIKALPPQNSEFHCSSIVIKYIIIIIIIIIIITMIIVIKTFTSSTATLIISLASFWQILEDKPFFFQKFLMQGTENPLTFGYFFFSEFHLFRHNKDSLSITDKKIENNFINSYDVLFNLQPTTVNVLSNLIQFQSNFNSILEPTCQKKLWWDPFQIKKRKSNFKILKLIFWFEMKKRISKISFIFQIWLLNWKMKNEKKLFLNLFWFKTDFKK